LVTESSVLLEANKFEEARIEINYGVNDLRLLAPLRGLASARLFELTQRRYAEVALLRSLEIVNSNPNRDEKSLLFCLLPPRVGDRAPLHIHVLGDFGGV